MRGLPIISYFPIRGLSEAVRDLHFSMGRPICHPHRFQAAASRLTVVAASSMTAATASAASAVRVGFGFRSVPTDATRLPIDR